MEQEKRECGIVCDKKCPYEGNDLSWVLRRGGCPFNHKEIIESAAQAKRRLGQQKQKHQDRSYTSKNEGKAKFRD